MYIRLKNIQLYKDNEKTGESVVEIHVFDLMSSGHQEATQAWMLKFDVL